MSYHAQALAKDVDYALGYVTGRANVAAVRGEIAQRRVVDLAVVSALDQLEVYFKQLEDGHGEAVFNVAKRQEVEGELLDGDDAELLLKAEKKRVPTAIDKREAMRLAELVGQLARSWE